MAKLNKQVTGEFSVTSQDVLDSHEKLVNYKLDARDRLPSGISLSLLQAYSEFLELCNAVDYVDVCNALKRENLLSTDKAPLILSSDYHFSEIERDIMNHLLNGKTTQQITTEEKDGCVYLKLGDVKDFTMSNQPGPSSSLLSTPQQKNHGPCSDDTEKVQVLRVFISYLTLLVNSRDELALAHVINIPFRELAVQQFADIRRHARGKKMSMFQTILSFMMQIRLGGKGYAPDCNCPLQPHTKGLGEFVSLVNKLQTTVEEETKPNFAVQKIVNIIKSALLKDKKRSFTQESIKNAVQHLKHTIKLAVVVARQDAKHSTIIGLPTLQLIQAVVDYNTFLEDKPRKVAASCLSTPLLESGVKSRVPSLLTNFRTPDPELVPEEVKMSPTYRSDSKSEREENSKLPYRSNFAWALPAVSLTPISTKRKKMYDTSSRLLLEQALDTDTSNVSLDSEEISSKPKTKKIALESAFDKENVSSIANQATSTAKKVTKPASRQILQDKTNQRVKKNVKTNTRKKISKLVVPSDQKRLTQFFR